MLAASREFYDNAETGNLHSGNMKLAFEWCVLLLREGLLPPTKPLVFPVLPLAQQLLRFGARETSSRLHHALLRSG